MAKSNKYRPKKITGSLIGRMVKVVPTRNGIEIYVMPTWMIILSVWVFAGAFFTISLLFNNFIVFIIMAAIGGITGYILSSKYLNGKLKHSFDYKDITCIIPNVPDFTIVHGNEKMFEVRILTNPQKKLLEAITEAVSVGKYNFVKKHGRYYFATK